MNIFDYIKIYIKIKGEVNKMKSGFLSSEFWLNMLGIAVMIALAYWTTINLWLVASIPAITAIYTIARTVIKVTVSKADDEVFNKVIEKLKPIFEKLNIPVEPV